MSQEVLSPNRMAMVLANGSIASFTKANLIDPRLVSHWVDQQQWLNLKHNHVNIIEDIILVGWGDGALDAINGRVALPNAFVTRSVIWNGNFSFAPAAKTPTLYITDARASWLKRYLHQWAAKRRGAPAQYQHLLQPSQALSLIQAWATQPQRFQKTDVAMRSSVRTGALTRRIIAGGAALALLTQPAVAAVNHDLHWQEGNRAATSSTILSEKADAVTDFSFDDGITLDAQAIKGDGLAPLKTTRAKSQAGQDGYGKEKASQQVTEGHPTNRQVPPGVAITRPQSPKGGQIIRNDQIRGDGNQRIQGTGSKTLQDVNGLKYFINTNITFTTSSSASAGVSEASFVGPVQATTLGGGFVSSTLNDAFDGYQSICIDIGNVRGAQPCVVGNQAVTMYNKNGPASLDATCGNRQVLYPVQNIGGVEVSRKVFVPSNDSFIRWANILKNTTGAPITLRIGTGNNLGSDSQTTTFNSSSGDTNVTTADDWYGSFQNYSGSTSGDVRLGHIMQGPGASVPVADINAPNGDDNPFWGYVITLQPGETKIILNYATGQASKAAVSAKSADILNQIASGAGSNALACLSAAELSQVSNFNLNPLTPPKSTSGPDLALQQINTAQIQLVAPSIANIKVVPTGANAVTNKTYEVVVVAQNTSPVAAPAVLASLNVPEGLSVSSVKWEKEGQFYDDGNLSRTCSFDGRTVFCGIGTLWSGMKATITLKVTALPGSYHLGIKVEDLSPLFEVTTENQKTITLNLN